MVGKYSNEGKWFLGATLWLGSFLIMVFWAYANMDTDNIQLMPCLLIANLIGFMMTVIYSRPYK